MLTKLTISELTNCLGRGECSAVDAMQACLDRIKQVDGRIKAFLSVDADEALAHAAETDRKIAAGARHEEFPLLGVPLSVKDVLAVKGAPLNCGSKILDHYRSPFDATVVEKMRNAGATIFGRLNMDEFAMGSSNENSGFWNTHNPWHLDFTPGGSSGGPAAAVVAEECFGGLGSDTGGSIRQPAALSGCVGLKPSYGRVSRYGLVAYASSLDQVGPLTKTVKDAALLLGVIAGHDARDSTSVPRPVPHYLSRLGESISGMRIGVPKEHMVGGLSPEVKSAIEAALKQLTDLGAEIVEISLPHTEYAIATYYIIATAEASTNLARFDGVRYGLRVDAATPLELYSQTRGAGFGTEVKRRIILGTYVLSSGYYDAYYVRAQKVRTLIRQDFLNAFEKVDAIATPTSPTPAFRLGAKSNDPLEMYLSDIFTISCNLAGICGVSVPCGFTQNPKLPIGLQLLGKPFGEEAILKIAHAYESSTPWHRERPELA